MGLVYCSRGGMTEGKRPCGRRKLILTGEERVKISKFLGGLLRHFPERFGIEIDRSGFASLEEVVRILKMRFGIDALHLRTVVAFDRKRRFEIKNGKIRARYGHSIDVDVKWSENGKAPNRLYHATSPENLRSILSIGLIPLRRKEVHMTEIPEEAVEVGLRHSPDPALFEIDAEKAMSSGIDIRKKGKVFTADRIPAECIRVVGWKKK